MLQEYMWNGSTWQFDEEAAPKDAVPLNKMRKPASRNGAHRAAAKNGRDKAAKEAEAPEDAPKESDAAPAPAEFADESEAAEAAAGAEAGE